MTTAPAVLDPSSFDDVLPRWLESMLAGDFETAWRQTDRIEHDRRVLQQQPGFTRTDQHLIWNGGLWADRTVLIRCWHGLGDTIQFLRYVPLLKQTARSVIVQVQPMLLSLCQGLDGADAVLNGWTKEPDPVHDIEIECMELPYAFRSTVKTLPSQVPYLPVERLRERRTRVLGRPGMRRIGLVWASSSWNSTRSLTLSQLAPLWRVPGVQFYSLQQGPEQNEAEAFDLPLAQLSAQTADIADAAAAMLQMDLMICVDTMAAHLAGALGVPVWTILKHEADWRWMRERNDSPWYPTMRLFRQPAAGDWAGVFGQLREALRIQIERPAAR